MKFVIRKKKLKKRRKNLKKGNFKIRNSDDQRIVVFKIRSLRLISSNDRKIMNNYWKN